MIIAVSSTGRSLSSMVNPRFGRSSCFVVVDTATGDHRALDNSAAESRGGAGIETARLLLDNGVDAVVAGYVGPHAFDALKASGIKVFAGVDGTVEQAVLGIAEGRIKPADATTGPARPAPGR